MPNPNRQVATFPSPFGRGREASLTEAQPVQLHRAAGADGEARARAAAGTRGAWVRVRISAPRHSPCSSTVRPVRMASCSGRGTRTGCSRNTRCSPSPSPAARSACSSSSNERTHRVLVSHTAAGPNRQPRSQKVCVKSRDTETVIEIPFAADCCPCVEKLRTVLPFTVGIRDGCGAVGVHLR
jgi:hypothetical protein